jgi:hypothetical protein
MACLLVAGEYIDGQGLVFSDFLHADIAEAFPGGTLDVLQDG